MKLSGFDEHNTRVVHCRKSKYDVYIGRPSKWGNPFEIGKDGTRKNVIKKYEQWILTQPQILNALHELRGKVLGCWCKPKPCHGDVLIKLINEEEKELMNTINITLKLEGPEIVKALNSLTELLGANKVGGVVASAAPSMPEVQQPTQLIHTPPVQPVFAQQVQTPGPAQMPVQIAQPMQQPVQMPTPMTAVPTTAQTYSMDQLAVAATQLMDAGRANELRQLLASFGVQALTMLPKEHYGAFAPQLRAMGAKI